MPETQTITEQRKHRSYEEGTYCYDAITTMTVTARVLVDDRTISSRWLQRARIVNVDYRIRYGEVLPALLHAYSSKLLLQRGRSVCAIALEWRQSKLIGNDRQRSSFILNHRYVVRFAFYLRFV